MRSILILPPLIICASAVVAQPAATVPPPQLTDPAMAGKLADAAQALSKALLDLPVGELQAAAQGREATAADRKLTVRDLARRGDPNFDRNVRRQIAEAGPKVERGMKALAEAWPSVMEGLEKAQESLERASANMPDPTYPKR